MDTNVATGQGEGRPHPVSGWFAKAVSGSGVPRVTLTDLRASASTWLLDEGVPKHLIVRLGRWRDETMLDRRYYRRSTPALRGAAEALSRPPPH